MNECENEGVLTFGLLDFGKKVNVGKNEVVHDKIVHLSSNEQKYEELGEIDQNLWIVHILEQIMNNPVFSRKSQNYWPPKSLKFNLHLV